MKPLSATQDPSTKKEAPKKMEIFLGTLPLPAMANPTSKGPRASEIASTQPVKAPSKEKFIIKKK